MQYFIILTILIVAGVAALFTIKNNDALLIGTIIVVIVGFIFGVSRIAKEKDKE
ncbi:MAG: hypothetical protein GY762_21215 [Proteobacteria bacterium]|nr:hypothetical protein [Pseudomonadota bacterium]